MSIFGWSLPPGCGQLPGEEDGVYEFKVDGTWWALTESDELLEHVPGSTEREDNYVYRGTFTWPEHLDSEESVDSLLLARARSLKTQST